MTSGSVVAVYGLKPGQSRPTRLGPGALVHPKLVLLRDPLGDALAAANPPTVLRVGIGSNSPTPLVEVIEVLQTMESLPTESGPLWAVELVESSRAPLKSVDVDPPLLERAIHDPQAREVVLRKVLSSDGQPAGESSQGSHEGAGLQALNLAGQHSQLQGPVGKRFWCALFPNSIFCH